MIDAIRRSPNSVYSLPAMDPTRTLPALSLYIPLSHSFSGPRSTYYGLDQTRSIYRQLAVPA